MIIQMKATEQYFPLVLFVLLYKLVINIKYADGILKCGRLVYLNLVENDSNDSNFCDCK